MIEYTDHLDNVREEHLHGFFVGWPDPPTTAVHLRLLRGSSHVLLAVERDGEGSGDRVVGFVTAISDGALAAYMPLLEVLPEYQGRGIGSELVRRMLDILHAHYMIDVVCDAELVPFYERFGLRPARAMVIRNYDLLSGT